MTKTLDSENIFRMYLDSIREASDSGVYDSYAVLAGFNQRLETLASFSSIARRYQGMIKEVLDRDPRVQRKLF